jgi:hypothetical protein
VVPGKQVGVDDASTGALDATGFAEGSAGPKTVDA